MTPSSEDEKLLIKIMLTAAAVFLIFCSVIVLAICGLIAIIEPRFFA